MLEKINNGMTKLEVAICELLIVILVAVVFMNAVLRLFNAPLSWSNDVAQLIFIWVSFLGADIALKKDRHSGVDVIVRRFPKQLTKVLTAATYVAMIVFLAIIGRSAANLAVINYSRKFNSLNLSYSAITIAVPVGCVLMILTSLMKLLILFGKQRDFYKDMLRDPEVKEEDELK
ncbi:MAG: TRAP transporter small permease [Lachnospiraceae bacterium]|nr:TRAP transporter small permease [Lachnospiraceae bacterium]